MGAGELNTSNLGSQQLLLMFGLMSEDVQWLETVTCGNRE